MIKADIVNEISRSTGIDKQTVLTSVEAFMETVKRSLIQNENVYLRGFGSFIVKKRAQKTARNISKNTTLIIPEHNIPSFKPAKSFLNEVKGFNEEGEEEKDEEMTNTNNLFNTFNLLNFKAMPSGKKRKRH